MDRLENYRQAVRTLLTEHAEHPSTCDTVHPQLIFDEERPQLIFDEERGHYQLNYVGWEGYKRVFGPIMHFDIQNDKIWVQYNGTEEAVAQRLVDMGVPHKNIVLGFHSAFKRQYTPYAVE